MTSRNSRYHFCIDKRARLKNPLDDLELPESIIELIILRVRFHGIIDNSVIEKNILANVQNVDMYERNVEQMLSAMPEGNEEKNLENLFGYLFVKAVEAAFYKDSTKALSKHVWS